MKTARSGVDRLLFSVLVFFLASLVTHHHFPGSAKDWKRLWVFCSFTIKEAVVGGGCYSYRRDKYSELLLTGSHRCLHVSFLKKGVHWLSLAAVRLDVSFLRNHTYCMNTSKRSLLSCGLSIDMYINVLIILFLNLPIYWSVVYSKLSPVFSSSRPFVRSLRPRLHLLIWRWLIFMMFSENIPSKQTRNRLIVFWIQIPVVELVRHSWSRYLVLSKCLLQGRIKIWSSSDDWKFSRLLIDQTVKLYGFLFRPFCHVLELVKLIGSV